MSKRKRLGRGLDALLGGKAEAVSESDASTLTVDLPTSALKPGRYQPRKTMLDEELRELAASIRQQGVLQPLVVRVATEPNQYEIVAGERRWRAAQLAGLTSVPATVRQLDDQSALAIALIENLQREDLNPIEQANSLARLASEFDMTHQQVADAVGRSRSSVSNLLRLLDLQDEVQEMLASGDIDMGHARALLSLKTDQQISLARSAATSGQSVRQVEKKVRSLLDRSNTPDDDVVDLQTRWLQKQLATEVGHKVAIRVRRNGSCRLDVDFADLEQLETSLAKIVALIGQVRSTAGPRARDENPRAK